MAFRSVPGAVILALALPAVASGQAAAPLPVVNTPGPAQATLPPQQIMQLVAPVALYPDPVLTDILAAATYPTQVVEAARFIADPANAGLQGAALAAAASGHGWDQSVQALLAFPPVLQMMDTKLEWTEQLGRAFVAQQADVMNAIQALRHQAQAAGTLASGPQESVVNDGGDIAIYPPSQQLVYLPAYDPSCAYGPGAECTPDADYVVWDAGVFLPYGYWQWGYLDWPGRLIRLDHDGRGGIWHHPAANLFGGYRSSGGGEHYNYAPPATRLPARSYARAAAPARYAPAPALRGASMRTPASVPSHPAVGVAHAAGGFERR